MSSAPPNPPSSAPKGRSVNWRTPFLAIMAAGTLAWGAITQFGISVDVILDMLVMSVVFLGTMMGAALVVTLSWRGVALLLSRYKDSD